MLPSLSLQSLSLLAPLNPAPSARRALPPVQGSVCAVHRVTWLWGGTRGTLQLSSSLMFPIVNRQNFSRQHDAGSEIALLLIPFQS